MAGSPIAHRPAAPAEAPWLSAAHRLLSPLLERRTPGGAGIELPGRPSRAGAANDRLEGVARSLWIAGPLLSREPDITIEAGEVRHDLGEVYRRALVTGTVPSSSESWHHRLGTRQTLVEACAIAWNLWLAREALWQPLQAPERATVLDWLERASRIPPHDNNWRLFTVVVSTVVRLLGGRSRARDVRRQLGRIESFYLGDGWYTDGPARPGSGPAVDYYNAWVFHPYLMFWSLLDGDSLPAVRDRVRERTRLFLTTFDHFFAADGSYPCFGRSATYRTAITAVFPWAALAGALPGPAGRARRLGRLVLERFLREPGTLDPSGLLTLGFYRAHPAIAEAYSGPASPYWAGKAFGVLAVPPENDFWQAAEAPLPIEEGDYSLELPSAGLLVQGSRATGQVQLVNARSLVRAKKYSNLAYASHFGYEIERSLRLDAAGLAPDASLQLRTEGSEWFGRSAVSHARVRDGVAAIASLVRVGDDAVAEVDTAITFLADLLLRLHRVRSPVPVYAREGGFACGWQDGEPETSCDDVSYARAGATASGIRPLLGFDRCRSPLPGGHNVLYLRSVIPLVESSRAAPVWELATVSLARSAGFPPSELPGPEAVPLDSLRAALDALEWDRGTGGRRWVGKAQLSRAAERVRSLLRVTATRLGRRRGD